MWNVDEIGNIHLKRVATMPSVYRHTLLTVKTASQHAVTDLGMSWPFLTIISASQAGLFLQVAFSLRG